MGRELERRWEESLTLQRQVELEYERWQRSAPGRLSAEDERAIRSLASDLPAVWHAATTTPVERKKIDRLSIEHVSVTVDKASERVDVEIHWTGGLVQTHTLNRLVVGYEQRSDYPRLVSRLRTLCEERLSSAEIADRLNAEGFKPPKRTDRFTRLMVLRLTSRLGLKRRERHGSPESSGQDEYRPKSLAVRLGVRRDTVRWWVRAGYVTTRKDAQGHHVIWADAAELQRLRALHQLLGTRTAEGLAELKKPRPGPESLTEEVRLTSSRTSLHRSSRALWLEHRACRSGLEKTRWQVLWLLTGPASPTSEQAAEHVGLSPGWVRQILKRWNCNGPEGLVDRRVLTNGGQSKLTTGQQIDLWDALQHAPPDGGLWTGPKVAAYVSDRWGIVVCKQTGWGWLLDLGFSLQVPRSSHAEAATPALRRAWKRRPGKPAPSPASRVSRAGRRTLVRR